MLGLSSGQLQEVKGRPSFRELGIVRIRWFPRPVRNALAQAIQDGEMLEMISDPERSCVHSILPVIACAPAPSGCQRDSGTSGGVWPAVHRRSILPARIP